MGRLTRGWVTCDICDHGIKIAPVVEPTAGGGEKVSFSCAHCGHVYLIADITARGLEVRANLKQVLAQLKKPDLSTAKRVRFQTRADRLRAALAVEVRGPGDLAGSAPCQ